MESKFKYGAYILVFLIVIFSAMLCLALSVYIWVDLPIAFYIVMNLVCILVWVWLVYGELRTKVIAVNLGFDNFKVKRYLGLGPEKTYYFNNVEGYKTSILPAYGTAYEYLYVMEGGKKVIKLSEFYHKNYAGLKDAISSAKIKNLGFENFNYALELKEIFS
jgi:hypothetical protein